MSVNGTNSPHASQTPPRQGQEGLGTDLTPGGRDTRGDARPDTQARQDSFGRAMTKAMSAARKPFAHETPDTNPAAVAAVMPLSPLNPPVAEPTPAMRSDATSIAERIDRYLRGAEGAASLRQGDGMVVKLPANGMGVTQVSVRLEGDILHVSLSMQAQAGAAQMALLGQALQLRQPRYALRLSDDAGEPVATAQDAPFNPLIPRGRPA